MNMYPADREARATQANSIRVDAIVHTWTYDDGWATGTATFFVESSLADADLDLGDLVTEPGSFEINRR